MARGAAPTAAVEILIREAERRAARQTAIIRLGATLFILGMFALAHPRELPGYFVEAVFVFVAVYALLAGATFAVARSRFYRGWMIVVLAVIDVGFFALLAPFLAATLDVDLGALGALPPFLFVFVLIAFAAQHYSPWPVIASTASFAVLALGFVALQFNGMFMIDPNDPLPPGLPIFTPRANLIRTIVILAAAVAIIVVVVRARRLLGEAIAVTERSANLSRYLPRPVAALVAAEGTAALGAGRMQPAAVLFADIVGFTKLSSRLAPEAVGLLLTEIRNLQRRAIEDAGGFVDKFMGDGVMAVFGVPRPGGNDALNAIRAAEAMQEALARWNADRSARGEAPIALGIGVHHGPVFAGAIGDAERLEFATLGDTVNVAQRVEELTRSVGATLLVSEAALAAAGTDRARWRALPPRTLRGRDGAVVVYRPA